MPLRTIAGSDLAYFLLVHDADGNECPEPDGRRLSDEILRRATDPARPVTDIFFTSHGWKGDVPAAIEQYDRWIGAMGGMRADIAAAQARRPGFRPLVVGLHWPSLPWGDEDAPAAAQALLSAEPSIDAEVERFAANVADSSAARAAIRTIVEASRRPTTAADTSPLADAYAVLFGESGLQTNDPAQRPGAEQAGFDPAAIMQEFAGAGTTGASGPQLLSLASSARDIVLSPLRQLSFWNMKDRARRFGEGGAHALLRRLQTALPGGRFHLMGHSFGCIVVSAAVAGPPGAAAGGMAVDSLFLVQGALSLWSFAPDISFKPGSPGYFNRILQQGLVKGPIVTTRSRFDRAVGLFYPLGARAGRQTTLDAVLGGGALPQYGGIGSFGIQGLRAQEGPMRATSDDYGFQRGAVYNLEASDYIRLGGGASGAHNDIAHPAVAHAFWSAVLAGLGSASKPSVFLGRPPQDEALPRVPRDGDWRLPTTVPRGGLLGASAGVTIEAPAPAPVGAGLQGSSGRGAPAPVRPAPPLSAANEEAPAASSAAPARWINVEIEGRDPQAAIDVGEWIVLAFDVDVEERAKALATAGFDEQAFAPDEEAITLTVQLNATGFELLDPAPRTLQLGRHGRSSGAARFALRALARGEGTLTATFHKEGNFIQQMVLRLVVGQPAVAMEAPTVRGRPLNAASVVSPRSIGLSITPGLGGYECVAWGAVAARARLTLQPAQLEVAIDTLRNELMKVVAYQNARGDYVFQARIDIDPAADAEAGAFALRTLARAGASLFQTLFFGPGAGADSAVIGRFLRDSLRQDGRSLTLQVLAEGAPIPWGLLYVGDLTAPLDWGLFVGMRHVIEQIPLQTSLAVHDEAIASDAPGLTVSVNVNDTIDRQMDAPFVEAQSRQWRERAARQDRLHLIPRSRGNELTAALADAATADQIMYFYCHAEAADLKSPEGPGASCIVMSDARLKLGDLNLDAPTDRQLPGHPLVFINACESAQMSPAFYDGFVPYFMAKGARGVVGTECKTPALFAATWADRFFERFLAGEKLGQSFLALRQEFLALHGNPLGLMYAVHCDADTRVSPAL